MTKKRHKTATRDDYRYAELRRALFEAGIESVRVGRPDGIMLREATRHADVVSDAAYRHLASR